MGEKKPVKKGKQKRVSYDLIRPDSVPGRSMYAMLRALIEAHHDDLERTKARIALAYALSWKADVDGRVKLGQCKKASDLDRELHAHDFVILLNAEFWQDGDVSDDQRRALLDHELMHAQVKLDDDGEYAVDTKGRYVFRTRKHDIEEFSDIVRRHGVWKRDLEEFYAALRNGKQARLPLGEASPGADPISGKVIERLASDPSVNEALRKLAPKKGSGIESVTISSGNRSVTLTQKDRARMDAEKR
jgi:hypothetical protein